MENDIPYSAWALLCYAAGHGLIWDVEASQMRTTQPARGTAEDGDV
ncbi:hypothetical protein [Paraburkholderia rhynchosiae]|uniref:Uncharacterized protein n=1 Tax=Paraburkholderia rhynchosiae TaxID=487049 RepID=A0A6J5CD06_9BURK|nr:hypothetical protein [Paraburkholderia rhynchosiae]CAB3734112.1 hypothetical protein LMG27174_06085 [Paraburkholderia rhynchosiae]